MKPLNRLAILPFVLTFALLLGYTTASMSEEVKAGANDLIVTGKVKTAILNEPSLKLREIGVETYQGTVQLSGFVGSHAEIRKADAVARAVIGVLSVKNELRLK